MFQIKLYMDICKTFPISLKQGSMPKGHETNYDAATLLFISVWLVFRPNAAGLVNTRHKYNWTFFLEEFTNHFINNICCFLGFNRWCISDIHTAPSHLIQAPVLLSTPKVSKQSHKTPLFVCSQLFHFFQQIYVQLGLWEMKWYSWWFCLHLSRRNILWPTCRRCQVSIIQKFLCSHI